MKYALFFVLVSALLLYWVGEIGWNDLFGVSAVAIILAGAYAVATEGYWRRRRDRWR